MIKGFINRFDKSKGFGFITSWDGIDYFFHHKDMAHSILSVEFDEMDEKDSPKGPRAINVCKAKKKEKKEKKE